jgi:N6-L-threonylcarbamoyladenine synthase
VTVGPGLEPALWTGIEFAKSLAKENKKPLIGANHLEGHLYSFLLPKKIGSVGPRRHESDMKEIFPATVLIASGGHTVLLAMTSFSKWRRLGETRDDAAGEAFDKVARLLDLPYPGGPEIARIAKLGNPNAIAFPRPMIHDKSYDFSFSGLKTSVLYYLKNKKEAMRDEEKSDIAASFQQAAIDVLVAKTMRATAATETRSVILCGGVAANLALQKALRAAAKKNGLSFLAPEKTYYGDNAAMIGAAGYLAYLRKKKYPLKADGTMDI